MHVSNIVEEDVATSFARRQKILFDKLSLAEKQCNKDKSHVTTNLNMEAEPSQSGTSRLLPRVDKKLRSLTKQFRGKESIFKRPEGPAPRTNLRSIADHHRNPHKWIKYSLADVSNDDMTDCSNARVAFSFLKELRARKMREQTQEQKDEMDVDDPNLNSNKIIFKMKKSEPAVEFRKLEDESKSTDGSSVVIEHGSTPTFRGSKLVMPEYVVGQKQKKKDKKCRPIVKAEQTKQLKLDHLDEFDAEED